MTDEGRLVFTMLAWKLGLFVVITSLILLAGCLGQKQRVETGGDGDRVTQDQVQAIVNSKVEQMRAEIRAEINADVEMRIGGIGGTGNIVNEYVWLDKLVFLLSSLTAPGSLIVYVLLHRTEAFNKLKHGRRYVPNGGKV